MTSTIRFSTGGTGTTVELTTEVEVVFDHSSPRVYLHPHTSKYRVAPLWAARVDIPSDASRSLQGATFELAQLGEDLNKGATLTAEALPRSTRLQLEAVSGLKSADFQLTHLTLPNGDDGKGWKSGRVLTLKALHIHPIPGVAIDEVTLIESSAS